MYVWIADKSNSISSNTQCDASTRQYSDVDASQNIINNSQSSYVNETESHTKNSLIWVFTVEDDYYMDWNTQMCVLIMEQGE